MDAPQSPPPPMNTPVEPGVPAPRPVRNPVTHARHRHEVLWQITVPVIAGVVILLALASLVGVQSFTGGDHSRWAAISLIWLISPVMFMSLIFLVILAGITYGIFWMIRELPVFARQVQDFFELLRMQISMIDNKIVEPILRMHASRAASDEFRHQIRNIRRKGSL